MAEFIFGQRNKIHIVNLERTLEKYNDAMKFVRQLAANRGTILVGTKRQARDIVAEEAQGRRALRRPSLARRHVDQPQDGQAVDQAAEGPRDDVHRRHVRAHEQARGAVAQARAHQAVSVDGRHQGHERTAGRHVRHRRGFPQDRGHRGEEARHPGRRGRGHQPFAGGHRT